MTATAIWRDWSCRVRITVTEPTALARAKKMLIALMADVSRAANRFDPGSELSKVNSSGGRMVPVSGRTIALVDAALDAAAETNGLVDPTIGRQLSRYGYNRDIDQIRGQLMPLGPIEPVPADWTQVRLDHGLGLVGLPTGMSLDLGATAKSWTADLAAHSIANRFGVGVLVELGGDVAAAGSRHEPWQVTVSELSGEPGQRVGLTHGGLATSSILARSWRTAEGTAHHIIDPRTGRPAGGSLRTATVWGPSAIKANTASTAAIILGDQAVGLLVGLGLAARLVRSDGTILTVGDWPAEQAAA